MMWRTYNYQLGGMPIADLPWESVTHILHVFVGIAPNGDVLPDGWGQFSIDIAPLISAAHSRGVKVLLCVGAIDTGNPAEPKPEDKRFWSNLYNNAQSDAWVTAGKISAFVNQHGYDGVAMDPEPWVPFGDIMPVFTNLCRALRMQLDPPKVLTSAAISSRESAQAWGRSECITYMDRIHLMTFNLGGHNEGRAFFHDALWARSPQDGHNAQASVDSNVEMYLSYGVPPDKLNIVLPFYGWRMSSSTAPFTLAPYPAGPVDQPDIDYNIIVEQHLPNANTITYDAIAQAAWANVPGVGWFSYPTPQSIRAKVDYVIDRGLGGLDAHHIAGQFFPNATEKHPLWREVVNGFAAPAPRAKRPCTVDIDEACMTRFDGSHQTFSGSITGAAVPSTVDAYVFSLSEQPLRYMPGLSTAGGRFFVSPTHGTGQFPMPAGEYWFYVFAPSSQILAKQKFRVLTTT